MDKIELIKQITDRHPFYGIDKKLSWYIGGMKDTGEWYFRKLLDMETADLQKFYDEIIEIESRPKQPQLTGEQQAEALRKFKNEREMKLITG